MDKVASFLGDGTNNDDANGDFVRCPDEVFIEERCKDKRYPALLMENHGNCGAPTFRNSRQKAKRPSLIHQGNYRQG